jgi:hypothetical protein
MSRRWAARDKGGLVRLYLAPLFWLSAGALALAFQAYTGSFSTTFGRWPDGARQPMMVTALYVRLRAVSPSRQ